MTAPGTGGRASRDGLADEDVDTYVVALPDLAGRLVGKRYDGDYFRGAAPSALRTCDVVFGWGIGHELLDGFGAIGWEHGYGDFVAVPDPGSRRDVAWWPRTVLLMADAVSSSGAPVPIAPRQVLREQVDRAVAAGFTPVLASELEFTVFDESQESLGDKGYVNLRPHGGTLHPELVESLGNDEPLFASVRRMLVASGIPVESIKAEYSRGQYELVISAAPAMRAADNHAVYKLGLREMCRKAGLAASFMAKWHQDFGGSSCHLHVSLQDEDGRNAFADGEDRLLRQFIGGLQRHAADVFLLWAMYPNSHKRLRPGTFAPSSLSWGGDNRTAAFRVTGSGESRHLENRVPGADVNPYLAYAGLLAAGMAGIEDGIEPDEGIGQGNAYTMNRLARIPQSLDEAIDSFAASAFARDRLGGDVVDHITNFCVKERDAGRVAVSDWDRQRLFDI